MKKEKGQMSSQLAEYETPKVISLTKLGTGKGQIPGDCVNGTSARSCNPNGLGAAGTCTTGDAGTPQP